jgi:hypothetical protein
VSSSEVKREAGKGYEVVSSVGDRFSDMIIVCKGCSLFVVNISEQSLRCAYGRKDIQFWLVVFEFFK